MSPPDQAKVYHITHVANLGAIIEHGGLVCDAELIRRGGPAQPIGMSVIKRRRVEVLDVSCHEGTKVGDYVPFYFCPRSVMLFVIHCANHPELHYRAGQEPIVHLEADLSTVVAWAERNGVRWAFSLSNAGAFYTEFRSRTEHLAELDWDAIAARDFRDSNVKERKQAEFLLYERFPFDLVERVGVGSHAIAERVREVLSSSQHKPRVEIRKEWYF